MEPNPCAKRLCQPTIYLFYLLWNIWLHACSPCPTGAAPFLRQALAPLHTLCPCDGENIYLALGGALLPSGGGALALLSESQLLASSLGQSLTECAEEGQGEAAPLTINPGPVRSQRCHIFSHLTSAHAPQHLECSSITDGLCPTLTICPLLPVSQPRQ